MKLLTFLRDLKALFNVEGKHEWTLNVDSLQKPFIRRSQDYKA